MLRSLLLLPAVLLLAACQTVEVQRDFDTNRDFTVYRDWRWADPDVSFIPEDDPRVQSDLTAQRIREAVSGQLDVRGLRPAVDPASADLKVKVHVIVEKRQSNVTTSYGGYWGGSWGRWGGGPGLYETRTVEYQVGTMQIDLLDARDDRLVWRGSDSATLSERQLSPAERSRLIQETVTRILANYPPR